jgi:hypothetical protein
MYQSIYIKSNTYQYIRIYIYLDVYSHISRHRSEETVRGDSDYHGMNMCTYVVYICIFTNYIYVYLPFVYKYEFIYSYMNK